MEFCPKCGSLMVPKKTKTGNTVLVCRKCGYRKTLKKQEDFKISSQNIKKEEGLIIVDKRSEKEILPVATVTCPKCGYNKAEWWLQQTRSSDEPPTRFFRCLKCKHVWREYE